MVPTATRRLRAAVGALAILTVIALVVLWPGEADTVLSEGLTAPTERAEVTEVDLRRVSRHPSPAPACGARSARERSRRGRDASTLPLGSDPLAARPRGRGPDPRLRAVAPPGEPSAGALPSAAPSTTSPTSSAASPMLWLALALRRPRDRIRAPARRAVAGRARGEPRWSSSCSSSRRSSTGPRRSRSRSSARWR